MFVVYISLISSEVCFLPTLSFLFLLSFPPSLAPSYQLIAVDGDFVNRFSFKLLSIEIWRDKKNMTSLNGAAFKTEILLENLGIEPFIYRSRLTRCHGSLGLSQCLPASSQTGVFFQFYYTSRIPGHPLLDACIASSCCWLQWAFRRIPATCYRFNPVYLNFFFTT